MNCRSCNSENLIFSKWIQWGEIAGKVFCYRCRCKDCNKSFGITRNKENFELVKDTKWQVSKTTIKHLKKCGKTIKDLYN